MRCVVLEHKCVVAASVCLILFMTGLCACQTSVAVAGSEPRSLRILPRSATGEVGRWKRRVSFETKLRHRCNNQGVLVCRCTVRRSPSDHCARQHLRKEGEEGSTTKKKSGGQAAPPQRSKWRKAPPPKRRRRRKQHHLEGRGGRQHHPKQHPKGRREDRHLT